MLDKKDFVKENMDCSSHDSIKHSTFVTKIRSCCTFHLPWRATFPWNWLCYFNMWSTTFPHYPIYHHRQLIFFIIYMCIHFCSQIDFSKRRHHHHGAICVVSVKTLDTSGAIKKNELLQNILSTKIFRNSSGNCWGAGQMKSRRN